MPSSELDFELLLGEAPRPVAMRVKPTGVARSGKDVLLGVDESNLLHLLVPLAARDGQTEDRRSAGVHLLVTTLEAEGAKSRYLDVKCLLPHLNRLFFDLVDEMLVVLQDEDVGARSACQGVLDRWRELLAKQHSGGLSKEQLAGLFAELKILDQLAERAPDLAVLSWTGPFGDRFDFQGSADALEVKASTVRNGRSVEIHGERQLEPPEDGDLYLVVVKLERVKGGGESVGDVVDSICARGSSRYSILQALEELGVAADDLSRYDSDRFVVNETYYYLVGEGFPRIVPASFVSGSLPAGVSSLRYVINLDAEQPAPLEPEMASQVLDHLVTHAAT